MENKIDKIIIVAVFVLLIIMTVAGLAINYHRVKLEEATEMAYDFAAQQYKNALPYDTTYKYDQYGNKKEKESADRFVLPENDRTKSVSFKTTQDKKVQPLRKRDFGD